MVVAEPGSTGSSLLRLASAGNAVCRADPDCGLSALPGRAVDDRGRCRPSADRLAMMRLLRLIGVAYAAVLVLLALVIGLRS
jgi:hypothetical protein